MSYLLVNAPYSVPMISGNLISSNLINASGFHVPLILSQQVQPLCQATHYFSDVQYSNTLCQSHAIVQPVYPQVQQQSMSPSPPQQLNVGPPSPPLYHVQQPQFAPSLSPELVPVQKHAQFTPAEPSGPSCLSYSTESIPSLVKVYALEINQSKDSVEKVKERYEHAVVDAFGMVLGYPNLNLTVRFINSPKKIITLEWCIRGNCDFNYIKQRTNRRDFEPKLICALTKVDDGSFGTYLNRGKQLTIVNEGWAVLAALQNSIISRGSKEELLALPEEQRFDKNVVKKLFGVSADSKGNALRGSTVCCTRFKSMQDILKMKKFVDLVQEHYFVQKSTMIVSLKKKEQYKGWLLYLDVGTEANVEGVKQLANQCNFKNTEVLVAIENQ